MKKIQAYFMLFLLSILLVSDLFTPYAHAGATTKTSDDEALMTIIATEETATERIFNVKLNALSTPLNTNTFFIELKGNHEVDMEKMTPLLFEKNITISKDTSSTKNRYIFESEKLDQNINFNLITKIKDDGTTDYHATLSLTENGVSKYGHDAFYTYIDVSGAVTFNDVQKNVNAGTEIYLMSESSMEALDTFIVNEDYPNYAFENLRKYDEDLNEIKYSIDVKESPQFKTEVNEYDVTKTLYLTEVAGTINNEREENFTIEIRNSEEIVYTEAVDKTATTYAIGNLPKFNELGEEINYSISIKEELEETITGHDIEIKKTEVIEEIPKEETEPEVTKEESAPVENKDGTIEESKETPETPSVKTNAKEETSELESTPTPETTATELPKTEIIPSDVLNSTTTTDLETSSKTESIYLDRSKLRSLSLSSPVTTMAMATAAVATPGDYTFTSNTSGIYNGTALQATPTITGIMSAGQDYITWTISIKNNTGYNGFISLKNISLSNGLTMPTSIYSESYNSSGVYNGGGNLGIDSTGIADAYYAYFYPSGTTKFEVVTPITTKDLSEYKLTIGRELISRTTTRPPNWISYDKVISGTFTRKAQTAKPTVSTVIDGATIISGTSESGSTVTVKNQSGTILGTAVTTTAGTYTVNVPSQTTGSILEVYALTANKIVSESVFVTVLKDASSTTTVESVYENETAIRGTGIPGSIITVSDNTGKILGSSLTDQNGNYYVEAYRSLIKDEVLLISGKTSTGVLSTTSATVLAIPTGGIPDYLGKERINPSPTYVGLISHMTWDERVLYRNRVPQPVEYKEGYLWKSASPNGTDLKTYDINLKTQGKTGEFKGPLDIVLVVDNSASMSKVTANGRTRWQNMKVDMNNFIDQVMKNNTSDPATQIRVSVVNYSDNIVSQYDFTADPTTAKNYIPANPTPGTTTTGGTFTQLGIRTGEKYLNSTTNQKMMIVLTDGAPTFSYQGIAATGPENITNFNTTIKGNGADFKLFGSSWTANTTPYTVNGYNITDNGQATISEARLIQARNPGVPIFTIGIDISIGGNGATPQDVENIIKKIATKPEYAFTTSDASSQLIKALNSILAETFESIDKGVVTDPIGKMFDLNLGSDGVFNASDYKLTASSPELLNGVTATYDPATRTIKLNNLTLRAGEWVNIKYNVKLRTDDSSFVSGTYYSMNERTTLKPTATSTELRDYPIPEAKYFKMNFEKRDALTNSLLNGATFELSNSSMKYTATSTNGLVNFESFLPGTYTLKETKAPLGYQLDPIGHTVTIGTNGSVTIDGLLYSTTKYVAKNQEMKYDFNFKKMSDTGVLAGATFAIASKSTSNTILYTATSGADGKVSFKNLVAGRYVFYETKAPTGYLLNDTQYEVEILKDGTKKIYKPVNGSLVELTPEEVQNFSVLNERITANIDIEKINGNTKETLANAEFTLSGGSLDSPLKVTTDNSGIASFKSLLPGQYQLKEIKAPDGYRLIDSVIDITISNTGEVTAVKNGKTINLTRAITIENYKSELPATGGYGVIGMFLIGVFLITFAVTRNTPQKPQ